MIVVVGGIKGGSGKTTIATNLTVMLSYADKKVLLVDADEQKSASSWTDQRENESINTPWATIQLSGMAVRNQIMKMRQNYDEIIIDVGGRDTTTQRSALTIADVFIIPFQPRSLDIWTVNQVKSLIYQIGMINPALRSYAIINRGDYVGCDNQDAINILNDTPELTCLPFIISQRKAFANAATNGIGVCEMKNLDKKAITEMQKIYDFLYQNDCVLIPK